MKTISKVSDVLESLSFKITVWNNNFECEKNVWNYPTLEEELRMEICEKINFDIWAKELNKKVEDLEIKIDFDSDGSSGNVSYCIYVDKINTGYLNIISAFYENEEEYTNDGNIYVELEYSVK